jgi:hypothetical protein
MNFRSVQEKKCGINHNEETSQGYKSPDITTIRV